MRLPCAESRDPGAKARLEHLGIEAIKDTLEGVVRGGAVGQRQESLQPWLPTSTESCDLLPIVRTAQDSADRDADDVQ